MEFTQDFAEIQGILTSLQNSLGEFTSIHHVGGNEPKISKVVEDLRHFLTRRKYLRNQKINPKHDIKLRKIVIFLILNTELVNKHLITNNKVAHLINIVPQLSKCLLMNVILKLNLCQYYGEAICGFPLQISLELLENCSKCIKKSDPHEILEQTSIIACGIYYKMYHLRYETTNKLDNYLIKLMDRFCDILKNYMNSVTDKMLTWPTTKMYQYMGKAIFEILQLLLKCFIIFNEKEFVAPYYQFYQFSTETTHSLIDSTNTLNKSIKILKESNRHLMSTCESNVVAVTLDVFCSWTECKINEIQLQEAVGTVAYEVGEYLKKLEDTGDLPAILSSIARKPKTIKEVINDADDATILENVVVKNEDQCLWYKKLIRSGIFNSEESFNIFNNLIHLSDGEDYLFLLNLNNIKNEFDLKGCLLANFLNISPEECIKIITEYFVSSGLNNVYESDDFDVQVREFFNKLKCDDSINFKEISVLVLQNPMKFMNNLLDESDKNLEHLSNILQILQFIKSICNIQCNDKEHTVFHEMVLNKLKHCNFEPNSETCIIQLVKELINYEMLSNVIFDQLHDVIEESIENENFKRAAFICQICKALPIAPNNNYIAIILKLQNLMSKLRWNFFTYSEDKCSLITEIIFLIYHYKTFLEDDISNENLKNAAEKLENKIDAFHIVRNLKEKSSNFLDFVSAGYDSNGNHHEQVCRLLKLLPRCVPFEWTLVAKCLIANENPISVLQLFIDVMLILSEMSKKSAMNQNSLFYCFQQFCIVIKDVVYSDKERNNDLEKSFIKNVCRLLKHLPEDLHNTVEVSLVNLFNFEVLKTLKDDEDFVYSLVSISHLNICKIICSKMS